MEKNKTPSAEQYHTDCNITTSDSEICNMDESQEEGKKRSASLPSYWNIKESKRKYDFTRSDLDTYLYGHAKIKPVDVNRLKGAPPTKPPASENNTAVDCPSCRASPKGKCSTHGHLETLEALSSHSLQDAQLTRALESFPEEVQLCTSSIPGWGYGVCAKTLIPVGTWVGPYEGKRVRPRDVPVDSDTSFMWEVFHEGEMVCYLDASDENGSSWMRFIRCARFRGEQNLAIMQYYGNIYYRAFKDIKPGVELLVWYSDETPQYMGLPMTVPDLSCKGSDQGPGSSPLREESTKPSTCTEKLPSPNAPKGPPPLLQIPSRSGPQYDELTYCTTRDYRHATGAPYTRDTHVDSSRRSHQENYELCEKQQRHLLEEHFNGFPRNITGNPRDRDMYARGFNMASRELDMRARDMIMKSREMDLASRDMMRDTTFAGYRVERRSNDDVFPQNEEITMREPRNSRLPSDVAINYGRDLRRQTSYESRGVITQDVNQQTCDINNNKPQRSYSNKSSTPPKLSNNFKRQKGQIHKKRLRSPSATDRAVKNYLQQLQEAKIEQLPRQRAHGGSESDVSSSVNSDDECEFIGGLWRCRHCNKSFTECQLLQSHECACLPEKPFKCSYCECDFSNIGNLVAHAPLHSGRKPMKCGFCQDMFENPLTLSSHIRNHGKKLEYGNYGQISQLTGHQEALLECM